ncbi:4'-phosphopantetheinyl transferase superfamily protein [Kutzneria viridogrisea]|uniref:Phosphopantetheinyl transferase n=2 Tax=Kutzneria TaxID=43356 RepID=W5W179_9PSEU|nr:4'-phosphopantetheinyl transferase superfamily protein [Kutzneria albida]AHH94592.1 phosphopantetheinyl transferase [Kutzneria albida DSM 43870]MBA8930260.1 4'-phosphopantetheinyl transferase EntD [Kutzneria viridogrisea]
MIEDILPAEVACAEAFDDSEQGELFAEELAVLGASVDKRRREFTTARLCARKAMAELGLPASPVLPGDRGAPQWPEGVVGSITHCAGYRAAVLAHARDLRTVGVDAEPNEPLPEGVLDAVSLPEERMWLRRLAAADRSVHWDRLLFSAKESVYKAWFPLARRMLGFEEASLLVDPEDGTFTARLLVPGPRVAGRELTGFAGRWQVRGGLVQTAIAVPAQS